MHAWFYNSDFVLLMEDVSQNRNEVIYRGYCTCDKIGSSLINFVYKKEKKSSMLERVIKANQIK
jgi:hypothetical protein